MFLDYGGDKKFVVKGYVDASFDTDPDDSKSQTRYVFLLNGGAIILSGIRTCFSVMEVTKGSS